MPMAFDNAALVGTGSCGCHQQALSPYALPDGTDPIVASHFVNNVHMFSGAPAAVTDIWEADEDNWGSWNPETQIDAGGFRGVAVLSAVVNAALQIGSGLTVVMIADMTGTSVGNYAQATMADVPDFTNEQSARFSHAGASIRATLMDYNDGLDAATGLSLGQHKLAANMLGDTLAMSVEGAAVQTFTPVGITPVQLAIQTSGGFPRIVFIGVYPAQPEADLPALSA